MADGTYIRKGRVYSTEEIVPLLRGDEAARGARRIPLDGDMVNIRSSRLGTFARSVVCACCGIAGAYFVKEKHRHAKTHGPGRNDEFFHLNLYALDDDWNEVMMTSDHIVPHCRRSGLTTTGRRCAPAATRQRGAGRSRTRRWRRSWASRGGPDADP